MSAFHRIAAGSTLAVLLSSTMLHAQITAPDVWQDWQATLAASGAGALVVGSEDYSNGTLTLRDLALTLTEDEAEVALSLPELVLTEQGDGSVAITMSARMPVQVTSESEDGTPVAMQMEAEQPDLAITATGTPDALHYALDVPLFALNLLSLDVEERDYEATGRFALTDITGDYASRQQDALVAVDYDIAATRAEFTLDLTEVDATAKPARTIALNVTGGVDAPQSAAAMTLPENAAGLDDAEALAAGFTLDGTQSAGATEVQFSVTENGLVTEGNFAAAATSAVAKAGGIDIAYGMEMTDLALAMTGGELPFPLSFTAARVGVDVAMPIAPSETASPYAFDLDLAELSLNEEVWALFDPDQTIPRDPATLRLDLAGLASVIDADAPASAAGKPGMADTDGLSDDMPLPAQIQTLDINDITLAFGGARIAASGALAFDPEDWAGDDMPMPVGTIDLALNGLNGLSQKLSALGLIPADQVMMGMMMLGMFTIPTGDDEMSSEIEFTEGGGITANGQSVF